MENFLIAINVIAPIAIFIAIGYLIKRLHMVSDKTVDQMNKVCFRIMLPVLLFNTIYSAEDISNGFSGKFIFYGVGSVIVVFIALMIAIPIIEKENKKRAVLIQGIFRSNFVIFGLPITISLCGDVNISATALLILIVVPLYNVLSVIALEIYRDGKFNIKKLLLGLITNPLIIGGVLGIVAMLIRLELPTGIIKVISGLNDTATPLALLLLGASFKFSDIRPNIKQITIGVVGKLLIIPLIFIPIYILAGFRGVEMATLLVMIAAPTAVSTFTMATEMEADDTLAGQIVVFDSIGSVFTMMIWIFILKQMAIF